MSSLRRILVSVFHEDQWGRLFVRGLADFGRNQESGWMLHLLSPAEGMAGMWGLHDWDGAVIQVTDRQSFDVVTAASCPVVLVDPKAETHPELPRILFDHEAVGAVAVRHLVETGRRHFAFLGFERGRVSVAREVAFVSGINQAGFECAVQRVPVAAQRSRLRVAPEGVSLIRRFVEGLRRPSAVFCATDELARVLLEICVHNRISVPEEVAILGAGDDDLVCLTCAPTLSSVRLPFAKAGEQAGRLLVAKPSADPRSVILPPVDVAMRDSTRLAPGEDREVEAAMRMIHHGFAGELRMEEIAAKVGLSLSTLERRFKSALGRTPLDELRRLRVHQAKHLLEETKDPLRKVAQRCGFNSAARFSLVFRELTGTTPMAFRVASRQREDANDG